MLRLILGRAGTGKTRLILDELRARVSAKTPGGFFIVPEQYSHEAEREMSAHCGDSASLYAEVLSFTRLSHRVAISVGGSARTYINKAGRLLQLQLVLDEIAPMLQVYSAAARQPELMSLLLTALSELRFGCADSEVLRRAAAEQDGMLASKLSDLALIREAMDAVEARTGADPASRMEVLAEQIPACPLFQGAAVFVDGFTDFTAQERAVLRSLWRLCDVTVALGCDALDGDSEVFAAARRTAHTLLREADEDGIKTGILFASASGAGSPIGRLEAHIFSWTDAELDAEGKIRLVTAPGMAAECELAAAEALRLVREEGARWRDIAVAVRGFEDYRPLLADTFRRWGVPLYATVRTDIFTRPLPALMGAAFDILSDGWSYESVFTYLKTGLTGLSREDCDLLENYVLTWALHGSDWTRDTEWAQHPDGFNREFNDGTTAVLRRINRIRRTVAEPLRHFAERGRLSKTARQQCEAVAAFWEELSLSEHITERARSLEDAGELQAAAEYDQLWELMVSALEQCAAVLGDMPISQEDFGRLFRRMLSEYDVGTIPVTLDEVTAGDFDRMRRRTIRHLLLLGCSDDRLPRIAEGGSLFTDTEREMLRTSDIELDSADDVLNREFNLIYQVLTLPSDTLTVFRSRFAADGSELRPSFVSDRIARLFRLEETPGDLTRARLSAPGPALELAVQALPEAVALFADDGGALERIEKMRRSANFVRGRLSEDAVRSIYKERFRLSATQIDSLSGCKFQYFMRYGLRAKPRQEAAFSPPERGTFLHYLLQHVCEAVAEKGGFAAVSDEEVASLSERFTDEFVHEKLQDFREKTPRFEYLFRQLAETGGRIVLDTAAELRKSDFEPVSFELRFTDSAADGERVLPPMELADGDTALQLIGTVDRVDAWEHDGRLYLRVVDYKSGEKKFEFRDIRSGLNLQMLLYLFSLEKNGQALYGKEIVPAGVLYVPAREKLLSESTDLTDEEIAKKRSSDMRRSGLLLDDAEVLEAMEHGSIEFLPRNKSGKVNEDSLANLERLGQLSRFVDELLLDMAGELRAGSIDANPRYKSEQDNTCRFCDFASVCHFDEKHDRYRKNSSLKAPDFWAMLDEKEAEAQ